MGRRRRELCGEGHRDSRPSLADTRSQEVERARATARASQAGKEQDLGSVRQRATDALRASLTRHLHWRRRQNPDPRLPLTAQRARDYLHDNLERDIGLEELALACGIDRFRLTRAFKAAFGLAPHAYLIQLRLAHARRRLALGQRPADVAIALGFADQSHLGRWFRRAYQLTPAQYRRLCSNIPD